MTKVGEHITLDIIGTKKEYDPVFFEKLVYKIAKISKVTVLQISKYKFEPQGFTLVALLAESHISFHTFPEKGIISFDFFTCAKVSPSVALEVIKDEIEHTNIVKKQEGNYFENLITYSLKYNKLDQNFQPTDGYINFFSQKLPIYSDDLSVVNTINASKYHSVTDNLILSGKFFFKAVNSIDDDVRVSRRVYIPTNKLRGFQSGKIGPKEGDEYVGGNYGTAINLNTTLLTLPLYLARPSTPSGTYFETSFCLD